MMTGSSAEEVASIVNAQDLPGLAPMDHDILRAQERATPAQASLALPAGTVHLQLHFVVLFICYRSL